MPLLRAIPDDITKMLICVDSVEESDFAGRIFSPYIQQPAAFQGILEMLGGMERIFDALDYPHPSVNYRRFSRESALPEEDGENEAPSPCTNTIPTSFLKRSRPSGAALSSRCAFATMQPGKAPSAGAKGDAPCISAARLN